MYLSIDPGQKGGAVLIDSEGVVIDKCIFSETKKNLVKFISKNKSKIEIILIENVRGYAGENVKSVFTFGKELGHIEGILMCHDFKMNKIIRIEPRSWVAFYRDCFDRKGKDKSCAYVKKEFKSICNSIYTNDALSDAFLIWYFWNKTEGWTNSPRFKQF